MVLRRTHFVVVVILLSLFASAQAASRRSTPKHRTRRSRHLRRAVWNPIFRGSHDLLVQENEFIDQLQLPRIANDQELEELEQSEDLVPVEDSDALSVSSIRIPNRRFCRPWTRDFLEDLSDAYYAEFHKPIVVTSMVRTMQQQKKLRRRNRNAGPIDGDTASTHLTGMTVDIYRRGMTRKQKKWVEQFMLPLKERGLIDPIEERRQPVFHITVYNRYSDWRNGVDEPDTPAGEPAIQTAAAN